MNWKLKGQRSKGLRDKGTKGLSEGSIPFPQSLSPSVSQSLLKSGFTLTEMLTVVVIIALLIGLLVPLVGKMRARGYATDSAAQIQVLRTAIEQYFTDHRAYPGPLGDRQIGTSNPTPPLPGNINGNVTGSENLTLGLIGGLGPQSGTPPAVFNAAFVGQGPKSLNPRNPKTHSPYLDNWQSHLSPTWVNQPTNGKTKFTEESTGWTPANDTEVPEFVDRFPSEPMPVLYLRAKVGAPGVFTDSGGDKQYNEVYITGYTDNKEFYGRLQNRFFKNGQLVLNSGELISVTDPQANAARYLLNPGIPPTDLSDTDAANRTGTARSKDSFVLISAGIDRIYGTTDDITSFGAVE